MWPSLRFQTSSAKSTSELFYQDTNDSHAYVAGKNSHLRKVLDKKQSGTVISSFEYELDAAGNRLGVTDAAGKYTQFGIDPKRQLVSETKWSAKTPGTKEWQYLFQYDPNGNRLFLHKDGVVTPYTYGDNNEMLTAGSETWTWDHFGNAKTKVVSGNTTTFGWDFESHLLSIDYPGTANDDTHEYDGNGLRMRSKLAGAANWTNFIWDELTHELLAEYTLISGTFTIKALNTYGLGLISTNREGTKRYFHFDALGSTAALDDENEALKDSYTYESFGVVVTATSTNGPSVNPFRFVGQWGYYDDGAMGSQGAAICLGIRYILSALGRFISLDAIRSTNRYVYVDNAAPIKVDPSGRMFTEPLLLITAQTPFPEPVWPWETFNPLNWGYGNWCGWHRHGPGPPVDCLDECCAAHDYCLREFWTIIVPFRWKWCDCNLCICALSCAAGGCHDSPRPKECRDWAGLVATLYCPRCASPVPT